MISFNKKDLNQSRKILVGRFLVYVEKLKINNIYHESSTRYKTSLN